MLPHRLERRLVMQARDRDALQLMLGAVAELLHRVPADAPLGNVAMHVVGKAQVFIDSNAVAATRQVVVEARFPNTWRFEPCLVDAAINYDSGKFLEI